jgi:molybdenum cofactor cytidylyltransferase
VKTGALVLAAGQASRFGSPKQLLEWEGVTLLDRACLTALAAACDPVLRVLGDYTGKILPLSCPPGIHTLVHPNWHDGMGSSLSAGLEHLLLIDLALEAVLILLPDQPLITPDLLRQYLQRSDPKKAPIILCDHGTATGPPALFHRDYFPELLALRGDQGAKSVAARHPDSVLTIPFPDAAWDLDTPEAWDRFIRSRATSSAPRSP